MNTPFRILSISLISAIGLAACEPAYLQDPNQNRTRDGAIIGGMLGAFLGAAADDDNRGRNAVLGAAAGAALGGAIGYSLDQQAADLRASMANENIVIDNRGDHLMVTMPDGILFDTDSAAIRAGLQADLRAMARNLQQYPASTVDVIGHTDNTGSAEYNQDLSARRASAVAGVLLEQGVDPARVRSFGRGENEPVATNLTPEGRQQNRRVEIIIRPTS
ncbi:OmpA family protein [Nioella sediminis]|jgi:outer membrane protein OmpA-like peptidoglycan-associated protein|uniref:OmpA family protein n=1 Tax=Nioella sediminis TaxID=1912092 RepID=UPI0008FD31B6|nr:OmpA family protein [Nioella sediminis]TBX28827.1 membrane protein [Roseovarius sp. JS7-11]